MSGFRKLRAALVIALTWGVFWGVVGVLFSVVVSFVLGAQSLGMGDPGVIFLTYAVVGTAMGLGFSGLTVLVGRREGWSLTRARAILLGALGGLVAYGLFGAVIGVWKGWLPHFEVLPTIMIAGLGAITGVLTFGTAARGSLPASRDEPKRISE